MRRQMKNLGFSLSFKGKVLSRHHIRLVDYNIFNRAVINVEFYFLSGGSSGGLENHFSSEELDALIHLLDSTEVRFEPQMYHRVMAMSCNIVTLSGTYTLGGTFSSDLYRNMHKVVCSGVHNPLWDHLTPMQRRSVGFTLYFGNKPLSQGPVFLDDYGICDGTYLSIRFHYGLGGSKKTLLRPLIELSALMGADALLKERVPDASRETIMHAAECLLISYKDFEYVNSKAEFLFWCQKVMKMASRMNITSLIYMTLDPSKEEHLASIVTRYITELDESVDNIYAPQSFFATKENSFEEGLSTLRSMLNTANTLENHPIVKRFVALSSFLLVHDMLKRIGVDFNWMEYNELEKQAMLQKFSSKKGFVLCVLDVALFIAERLYQVYKTGKWSTLLHSGSSYEQWLDKCEVLKRKSMQLANPAVHGFTVYDFISDMKNAIEEGEAIRKFSMSDNKFELRAVKSMLNDIKMLDANLLTKRAARESREAPFVAIFLGLSSIGKSGLQELFFRYYGSYFDLPTSEEHRFTRNPLDEYWSGYQSSCWCVQYDDIAAMNPELGLEDPTTREVLYVGNNVTFITPQADLPDKGKIPFMSELILASSNSMDLNMHHYYQNPGAALRRFGFPIHVEIKPEYASSEGFLDKRKAIPPTDGSLPNFWIFSLMKYEPYMNGTRQMAKLVPAVNDQGIPLKYTDTATFMAVFIRTVEAHKRAQVQAKNAYCREITVCKKCALPASNCTCIAEQAATFSEEFEECEWSWTADETYWYTVWHYISTFCIFYWIHAVFAFIGINLMSYDLIYRMVVYCLSNSYVRWVFWRLCDYFLPQRTAVRVIGWTIEHRRNLVHFSLFITGAATLMSMYSAYSLFNPRDETEEQGTRQSTGKPIVVKEKEKENVWHATNYECTTQDVPLASTSLVGADRSKLTDMLSNNVCFITMQYDDNTEHYSQMAVCVRGQKYITNAHAFKTHKNGKEVEYYHIRINVGKIQPGVSQIVSLKLKRSEVHINENLDLAVFEVLGAPPKKDITKFFAPHTFSGVNDGFLLCTRNDGTMYTRDLNNVSKTWSPPNCGTANCMLFGYKCPTITEFGECGALVIVMAPRGPIIGGFHAYVKLSQGKATENSFGICLSRENLEIELKEFAYKSLRLGDIEPGVIALDLVEGDRTVGPLHHKSVINYCEKGTANVYGTISGVRPTPRSKVNSTPLREVVEQRFERQAPFGPPVMKGWNVWRQNVLPMLDRTATYDKTLMSHCADAFTHDILNGLKESDPNWRDYVHPLDDYSTVNGINGVQYIDAMNFKSSMGNPWRKTKKSFIIPDPTEAKPDGQNFPPQVWDRVTKCHEAYMSGRRYMPVFEQHLKDESIPIEKILIEKTRAFSSAGVDFSLEMRKYLLPFVRLVQRNKFVFESGPGTVCQSAEWELIRDYLCAFGEDKIIAGDYKRFDKGMTADIILYAFSVVYAICKAAGYSQEDLKVIVGLAYDVAFPVSNVNGDLIEFFGTNPSGQALTVIINGIVNCLYIRYAFAVTAPDNIKVYDFKAYVRLMTYGDDNIMGVGEASWFTHAAVVSALRTIGVTYTASDKTDKVIDYVHINDESFLKRKWRFDEDVGFYLCPLDEESIFKSLTVWVPSDSVAPGFQMASVVQSAMYEYFYYGKEKFHEMRAFLQDACQKNDIVRPYIKKTTFPTWEHLVDNFMAASNGMTTKNHGLIQYERVYLEECPEIEEDVEYC
jgi:hypothetical protein